jgi:hypothetical protein
MISEDILERIRRVTKQSLKNVRDDVYNAISEELKAIDYELSNYDKAAGPILKSICYELNILEMDALETVVEMHRENRKLKEELRLLSDKWQKNKHYLGLLQQLRDRSIATGNSEFTNLIDNFLITRGI